MNLMVVSEKHGLLIVAVDHLLYVYNLDPVTCTVPDAKNFSKISLLNDDVRISSSIDLRIIERHQQHKTNRV